jgi:hypothetical protein
MLPLPSLHALLHNKYEIRDEDRERKIQSTIKQPVRLQFTGQSMMTN